MTTQESIDRLAAIVRVDSGVGAVANCEECGVVIPVEHARCSPCQEDWDAAADRFDANYPEY